MNAILRIFFVITVVLSSSSGQIRLIRKIHPLKTHKDVQFISISASGFGDIYLLESKHYEVYRIDYHGNVLNVFGGFGWGKDQFDTPMDICVNSGLDVFVADYNNHRIVRFDRFLNYLTSYFEDTGIIYPRSVAVSNLGDIYVLDEENGDILRIFSVNEEKTKFGGVEYGAYALNDPVQIFSEPDGSITALERDGRLIQFDRYGSPIRIISSQFNLQATELIVINRKFLILSQTQPYLTMYSMEQSKWHPVEIENESDAILYTSGVAIQDTILLLRKTGEVIFCSMKDAED